MSRIPVEWIDRYLTGVSSDEERAAVQRWLADAPEHGVVVDALRNRDGSQAIIAGIRGEDATWARVRQRTVDANDVRSVPRVSLLPEATRDANRTGGGVRHPSGWSGRRGFGAWPLWQRIGVGLAACTLLVALGVMSGDWLGHRSFIGTIGQRQMTVYATGNGQRATITLPDGTHVVLNVASRLEIPGNYATGNRTVRLQGAALFTVAHRDGAPFSVGTGTSTTHVLGTSFVVRHYATDSITTVAVRDGRVAVQPNMVAHQRVVTAGEQARMSNAGAIWIGQASPSQFTFAVGVLTIDGLPLSAAVVELDRWYNADIRVPDPVLAGMHIRGEFAAGSRADLAAMLEWTLNVRVVQDGRVLTLYRK